MIGDEQPLQAIVRTRTYGLVGPVTRLTGLDLSIRSLAAGDCTFTCDSDDPMVTALGTPGSRVAVVFAREDGSRRTLYSGDVDTSAGAGLGPMGTRTYTVIDDFERLNDATGWVAPTKAITAQGDEGAYWKVGGALETVTRALIQANVTRLGLGLRPPTGTAGPNYVLTSRMHTLIERLLVAYQNAGLGLRVIQDEGSNDHPLVRVLTGVTRPVIDEFSDVIAELNWERLAPTATRLVLGLGGEAAARAFRLYPPEVASNPSARTALEQRWRVREKYVDARDIDPADPDVSTLVAQRGAEGMTETRERVSLGARLMETDQFEFEDGFDLHDKMTFDISDAPDLTDRVLEIGFALGDDGLVITPLVGEWTEDEATQGVYRTVDSLARRQSAIEKGR